MLIRGWRQDDEGGGERIGAYWKHGRVLICLVKSSNLQYKIGHIVRSVKSKTHAEERLYIPRQMSILHRTAFSFKTNGNLRATFPVMVYIKKSPHVHVYMPSNSANNSNQYKIERSETFYISAKNVQIGNQYSSKHQYFLLTPSHTPFCPSSPSKFGTLTSSQDVSSPVSNKSISTTFLYTS